MKKCAFVFSFWLAAAMLVAAAHVLLDPLSISGGTVAAIAAIVAAAFIHARFCARDADVAFALGTGIAWLVLSIVAEVVATESAGHGWFALLGSPAHPLLRNLFLFVWIFAPALFSRRESAQPVLRNH